MPHATKVMIQMHAVMSEWERDQISSRNKAALAVAKTRGVKLGVTGPDNLRQNVAQRTAVADTFARALPTVLAGFKASGLSQRRMIDALNELSITSPRGGKWSLVQLQRVIRRIAGLDGNRCSG